MILESLLNWESAVFGISNEKFGEYDSVRDVKGG